MESEIRILILEDNPADAELLEYTLKKAGIKLISSKVKTQAEYVKALAEFSPDIILSDYDLPRFNGAEALKIAKERRPVIPFILVTGAIGEERAIEILTSGAIDYVMKSRLSRLVPAVQRAIQEIKDREDLERSEAELHTHQVELEMQNEELRRIQARLEELNTKYLDLYESAPVGYFIFDENWLIFEANLTGASMLGTTRQQLTNKPLSIFIHPEFQDTFHLYRRKLLNSGYLERCELKLKNNMYVSLESIPILDKHGNITGKIKSVFTDITERKVMDGAFIKELESKVEERTEELQALNKALGKERDERKRAEEENVHLSTFPRLNPFPVVEMDSTGQIKYLNPAAERLLPGLREDGKKHPWLKGLEEMVRAPRDNSAPPLTREIAIGDRWYSQTIYFVEKFQTIRVYGPDITARMRMEQSVRESEMRYAALFESTEDAIVVTDPSGTGRIIAVNPAACRLFGYSEEEFLNLETPREAMLDTSDPNFGALMKKRDDEGRAKAELNYKSKDGSTFPADMTASYFLDGKGDLRSVAIIRDITERKLAEKALRDSEQRYKNVVKDQTELICRFLPDGIITFVNPAFCNMADMPEIELLEKSFFMFLAEEDISRIMTLMNEVSPADPDRSIELRIYVKDMMYWMHWIGRGLYDSEGNLIEYQAVGRDITERKQIEGLLQKSKDDLEIKVKERTRKLSEANEALLAQEENRKRIMEKLRQSEETYRLLVETNPVGVFRTVYDPAKLEDKRLYCNEAHLRILGYSSLQEWLAGSTNNVFHSEADLKDYRTHLLKDRKVINYKVQMKRKDGRTIWVLLNSTASNRDGKMIIEGTLTDISEQKWTEERLRSAQKNLRAMASEIISADERSRQHFATDLHDTVVQTIAAAKLRSQLIQDMILPAAKPIFSELQDMLSESIAQARFIMAEMSPPVLYELGFIPALEWLTEQIEKQHGISIYFVPPKNVSQPLVHEIQILLFQATRELLMNIVKHAKVESAVVKISGNGDRAQIEVIDKGSGFDKKKAFRTDISSGGFGLFSIRERLRHIGGQLKIISKPGEGTRVVITAPRSMER